MRRELLKALLLASAAWPATRGWAADGDYPNRNIQLIFPFPPGSSTDLAARTLAKLASERLGVTVLVINRPGANGTIGTDLAAKAAPDGYAIHLATIGSLVLSPATTRVPYDPLKDFAPVSQAVALQNIFIVHPNLPPRTLKELIALAKARPGALNFASSGTASPGHLAGELFKGMAGVNLVHVPYKGGGPAVQSVLAGDTQLSFATPPSVLPLVQAGRLKALAVTSRNRSPLVPNVPGMAEAGLPDYEISFWYGFFVPAGTPDEAMKKLFAATRQAVDSPKVAELLAREGTESVGSKSPEDFAQFVTAEQALWARLVKESGAKPE